MCPNRILRLVFALGALTLGACASTIPEAESPRAAGVLTADQARGFCYPRTAIEAELALVKEKKHFRWYSGSFPSGLPLDDDPDPITFEFFEPVNVDNPPVAIVLPILNGQKHIVRPFATYYAKRGFASIIVDSRQRTTLEDDIVEPEAALERTAKRHRRMLDWVEQQPNLDASRVVVFGASLGGFNALFLAAVDDRVRAVVPALAAADLPYVFSHSTERRIAEAFENVMQSLELDRDELEEYLRTKVETGPSGLAPFINTDNVLMIIAKQDKAVPTNKQYELRALLGDPETIELPTGHLSSAAYIPMLQKRTLRFFEERLAVDGAYTASISPASCLRTRNASIMTTTDEGETGQ